MNVLGPSAQESRRISVTSFPSVLTIDNSETETNRTGNIYRGYISGNGRVVVEIRNVNPNSPSSSQLIVNELDDFQIPSGPEIVSPVFDIFVVDSSGNEVEFDGEAEICFNVTSNNQVSIKRSCLGYFNEITQEWECEDECLEKNKNEQFCGTTTHFTAFSVLFYGIDGPGAACSSPPNPYIFDEYWQDLILTASFIGAAICCFCLCVFCSRFYFCRRIIFGRETIRIEKMRHSEIQISTIE